MNSNYQSQLKMRELQHNSNNCAMVHKIVSCLDHIEFTNIHCPACQSERYYNKTHPGDFKKW